MAVINETPEVDSDSEVVDPKKKKAPLIVESPQVESDLVFDEYYDIVIEK